VVDDRPDVERHARGYEEQRDEHAVADRIELVLEGPDVHFHPASPPPQHQPGEHGAEHDVEPEPLGCHQ